ncbi:T9SS type A sorting domain-containing protein [Xanthomarina sp.]|uniref:T9SS type A sorting domain-containing protein n=1 Tax=Xanthomarina sp. TaxID=1931211 RepID=UPI002C7145F4|nr:T9SS type A sorting domain-containing protein [Xanthomarina sp.]HLV39960.1 T9SS type A sorting domain-containing protein [Xanthomarina sp.]
MKKITFALALLSLGVQAQNFPNPYCDVTTTGVEEITSISMAGTTITNSDTTSQIIDKTATVIHVNPGQFIFLEFKGNTHGNFDNEFVAYIDWDQNGILDDPMDVMQMGTITNSTGSDGNYMTLQFSIPSNAMLGSTRFRITKTAIDDTSVVITDPCALKKYDWMTQTVSPSAGQALDFTLNVQTLGVDTFERKALSIYPNPTQDVLNIAYKSAIQKVQVYNMLGQEVLMQEPTASRLELNVSTLPVGPYMLKLFTDDGEHTFRIIKK